MDQHQCWSKRKRSQHWRLLFSFRRILVFLSTELHSGSLHPFFGLRILLLVLHEVWTTRHLQPTLSPVLSLALQRRVYNTHKRALETKKCQQRSFFKPKNTGCHASREKRMAETFISWGPPVWSGFSTSSQNQEQESTLCFGRTRAVWFGKWKLLLSWQHRLVWSWRKVLRLLNLHKLQIIHFCRACALDARQWMPRDKLHAIFCLRVTFQST